jgi:phage regulator Rha-like protein
MKNELAKIQKLIYEIRGHRVMLDSDLAELYEVAPKVLNQAVKRNIERFPADFMFRLTKNEFAEVVTNCDHLRNLKYRPTMPYVFTEQGVAMLSSVVNSDRAIKVNIQIMRTFVQLRHYAIEKPSAKSQIAELQKLLMLHIENNDYKFSEYDKTIRQIVQALNNLIDHPKPAKRIGFSAD